MRNINLPVCSVLLLATAYSVRAEDAKAAIEQKLESEYSLTQPTADDTDIVTAGSVLVLQKGHGYIMMAPVSSTNFYQNTYRDGKITQNAVGKGKSILDRMNHLPGMSASSASSTRTFVPGEKMWLTKIDVKDDSVTFDLFTDAYSDVRYKAALKFQFAKGSLPPADEVQKTVEQVFAVQQSEDAKDKQQPTQGQPAGPSAAPAAGTAPVQAAAPVPPPAPIAPPPPPTDAPAAAPKSLSKGQTTDEVVANFGPPEKIIKLGTKQIYVYTDMKVTFVSGKVADVQ